MKKDQQKEKEVLPPPPGYSVARLAKLIGMREHTAYRWVKKGWIAATPLPNGHYRVDDQELDRLRKLFGFIPSEG
jgi:transposase-like protein